MSSQPLLTNRPEPMPDAPDRLLWAAIGGGALVSALLILYAVQSSMVAASFAAAIVAAGTLMIVFRRLYPPVDAQAGGIDWSLTREAADNDGAAIAITDRAGRLVCANDLYGEWFQGFATPPSLPVGPGGVSQLTAAGREAWRDGLGTVDLIEANGARHAVRIIRTGRSEDHLLWRFVRHRTLDLRAEARRLIEGDGGDRLGEAGIMAALVGGEGRVRSANRAFIARSAGRPDAPIEGRDFVTMLTSDREGVLRFAEEGPKGNPLRLMQMPLEAGVIESPTLIFLIDDDSAQPERFAGKSGTGRHLQTLLSMLPLGLALTDRDGRFLFVNEAFARAAAIEAGTMPLYPIDLVVREDKAALADAVRRFAGGAAAVGRDDGPLRRCARGAGRAHHRRRAGTRRCRGADQPQGFGRGGQAQAPDRAGHQDAGGRPARRRRRARFQQHPDRNHRPLRSDADAPLARRQRL
jgi:two-component system cell cycle sensor histidine kinase/response regulator CckA